MTQNAIHILYGTDHRALEARVFDEMAQMTHQWPDSRGFLIVPERMKADTERRYLKNARAEGLMMAEILSFNRFATRLFSESGFNAKKVISKAGKAVIAQKALIDLDLPFRRFHRFAGRPRYAAELVGILGDFQRYDIRTPDLYRAAGARPSDPDPSDSEDVADVERSAENTVSDGITCDKSFDFALLQETMEKELSSRDLLDPDTALQRLVALLTAQPRSRALAFLEKSAVWVLGFGADRNFTAQELNVLRALSESVGRLTVTVMADQPGNDGELAFQHGREALSSLSRLFRSAELIRVPAKERQAPAIRLVRAVNIEEETRYAAAEIRSLLLGRDLHGAQVPTSPDDTTPSRRHPLRRRDIAVAIPNDRDHAEKLHQALLDYGVDAYLDVRKPLTQSSFLRAFIAFLRLTAYDFSLDELMTYYRCGMSPLDETTIDLFENASLAAGWRSSRDFRKLVALDPEERGRVFAKNGIAPSDWKTIETALTHLRELLEDTSAMRKARSGRAKCDLLLNRLFGAEATRTADETNGAARVAKRRDALLRIGREESAILLVSSWNATVDFLVEASDILGDTRVAQDAFSRMMEAGISGLELSSIPTGADRVRVGTFDQIANWPCRLLYILGAESSVFPPDEGQEGYLRDDERDWLSSFLGKTFPNRKKSLPAAQAWLVRSLMTTADDRVSLFAPTLGDDAAPIFDELENDAAEDLVVTEPDAQPDLRWNALLPAQRLLRRHRKTPEAVRHAIESAAAAHDRNGGKIGDAPLPFSGDRANTPMMDLGGRVIALSPSSVRAVMTKKDGVSVSLLQSYNQCPFAFFADSVLGAKNRRIAEDAPNFQGELLHRMVDLAATDLVNAQARAATPVEKEDAAETWREALRKNYPRELYDRAAEMDGFGWYRRPERSSGIGERIALHAAETLLVIDAFNRETGHFPKALELYFPRGNTHRLILTSSGQVFVVRGLIDRVDINRDGAVRLYDYKRTGKSFSWTALFDGTDLQLPLYKAALEAGWEPTSEDDGVVPHVRELYFAGFTTPVSRTMSRFTNPSNTAFEASVKTLETQQNVWKEPDAVERVARFAVKRATRTLDDILRGQFAAHPTLRGQNDPCRYCAWRASCGFDRQNAASPPLSSSASETKRLRDLILNDN